MLFINQSDLDERSLQVVKMKTIYDKASAVFCWLGLPFDNEETKQACSMMSRLRVLLQDGLQEHKDDLYIVLTTLNDTHDVFPIPSSDAYIAWTGIKRMFNHIYWQRSWIYQEAKVPHPLSGTVVGPGPTQYIYQQLFVLPNILNDISLLTVAS